MFDKNKGTRLIDDFKRLAKVFPEGAARVRKLAEASDEDFVIILGGDPTRHIEASDTKCERRVSEREINVYAAAIDLMANAPTAVTDLQLKELHIRVLPKG